MIKLCFAKLIEIFAKFNFLPGYDTSPTNDDHRGSRIQDPQDPDSRIQATDPQDPTQLPIQNGAIAVGESRLNEHLAAPDSTQFQGATIT